MLTKATYLGEIEGTTDGQAPVEPKTGRSRREKALEQAYEQRKFEIELYWKRAAYFWTFIGASFVGYAAFLTGTKAHLTGALMMSQVGLVFSVAWYLVNRGSKYWQENWENHVSLLENDVTGPLYKMCAARDPDEARKEDKWDHLWISPQPRSVSKINTIVSIYVVFIWIMLSLAAVGMMILQIYPIPVDDRVSQAWIHGLVVIGAFCSTMFAWRMLLRQSKTHQGKHDPLLTLRRVTVARDPGSES